MRSRFQVARRLGGSWISDPFPWWLGALTCGSALAVGGAHWKSAVLVCVLTGITAPFFHRHLIQGWNPFSTLFALLSAWTLVGVIPIPRELCAHVAPETYEIWTRSLQLFGEPGPHLVTISLDPAGSYLEAAKWACYALVVAGAASYAAQGTRRNLLLYLVLGSAGLVCVVTFVHTLAGLESLFGVYSPRAARDGYPFGPFVNPNNLAGYSNLGVFAGLAIIGSRSSSRYPVPTYFGIALCSAGTILSASRAGTLALVVGALALAAVWPLQAGTKDDERFRRARTAGPPVIAVAGVLAVLALMGTNSFVVRELLNEDISKLSQLTDVRAALDDYSWTGTGRGAFETVSQRYFVHGSNVVARTIENFLLSWLVEWGLPVGGLAAFSFLWFVRPQRLSALSSRRSAATWTGIVVLLLQNLLDLALELPAIMIALSCMIGSLEGRRVKVLGTSPSDDFPRETARWKHLGVGGAILVTIIGALGMMVRGPDIFAARDEAHARFQRLKADPERTFDQFLRSLRADMLKRPAEPYFALIGTAAHLLVDRPALTWAAATLARTPSSGRAHLLTALALRQAGATDQALIHLRHAVSSDRGLRNEVAALAVRWTQDASDLIKLAPPGKSGALTLLKVNETLGARASHDLRHALHEAAHLRDPMSLQATSSLGFHLLEDLKSAAGPTQDSARVETLLRNLEAEHPNACEIPRIRAALEILKGAKTGVVAALAEQCDTCEGQLHCIRDAISLARGEIDRTTQRELEERYLSLACTTDKACTQAQVWLAGQAATRRSWARAYTLFVRAAESTHSAETWKQAATAAANASLVRQAQQALRRARALGADVTILERKLQEKREDRLRHLLPDDK